MNQLIIEVIESYNNYIALLPIGCLNIANSFRDEQLQKGLTDIKDFSEGVIWVIEVADLLQKNEIRVETYIEKIQGFLVEINEALENEDYILVADLFEYEIAPYFEAYPQIVLSYES